MDITFAQYPALAARTEKMFPTVFERLEHAALGIFTEVGEIGTPIKRITIYGLTLDSLNKDGKTTLRQNICEEIADTFWYLAIIDNVYGLSLFASASPTAPVFEPTAQWLGYISRRLAIQSGRISQFVDAYDPASSVGDLAYDAAVLLRNLIHLALAVGANPADIAAENIAKLQKRYPDAYSDVAAEARADKGGLDARNS